ncbi:MAG: MFS transporter [Clostridia bacterium]
MTGKMTYKHTMVACYISFVVQAIVNNLAPLLFITFQKEFGLSLGRISTLVIINFSVQMAVDFLSAAVADKIGYRNLIIFAHVFSIAGLAGMSVLPSVMPPFYGLLLAVFLYAVGGGLIEVLASPILEALPLDNKAAAMSLLHSFYCWGHLAVVLLSTLFFTLVGIESWRILPVLWAIVPFVNIFIFIKTPIIQLEENIESMPKGTLIRKKEFWIFMAVMVCAGASEQAMSQWASAFAEEGLGISKTAGDLLGPCMFAVLMGGSRAFYGKSGEKINLAAFMTGCGIVCTLAYVIAAASPFAFLSLVGCGLCGLCVGIMWPGTFSIASRTIPAGGTAMFALLALAGDVGCASGPALVGLAGTIRGGLAMAAIFPVTLVVCIFMLRRFSEK